MIELVIRALVEPQHGTVLLSIEESSVAIIN